MSINSRIYVMVAALVFLGFVVGFAVGLYVAY
jgi:hypothetical protein